MSKRKPKSIHWLREPGGRLTRLNDVAEVEDDIVVYNVGKVHEAATKQFLIDQNITDILAEDSVFVEEDTVNLDNIPALAIFHIFISFLHEV